MSAISNSSRTGLALVLNLVFGVLPSLAFFAWVERNCSLPRIPIELGWPWIAFYEAPIWSKALWDLGLFAAFAVLHSALAQPAAHRRLQALLKRRDPAEADLARRDPAEAGLAPSRYLRTLYMIVTGLSLTALMGLWQSTGIVVWYLPLPIWTTYFLSFVVFWSLMAAAGWVASRFDALTFVGIRQLLAGAADTGTRSAGNPTLVAETRLRQDQLLQDGIYGRIRHPMYLFTLLAFALTPVMTLDRFLVLAASVAYLWIAIPIEERKLVAFFGTDYERYRKAVPAVIPRLGR